MSSKYYLPAEDGPRDRWMISYTDVLTIVLIFFVAIAAQSLPSLRPTPVRAMAAQAGPAAAVQTGPAASLPKAPSAEPVLPANARPDTAVPESRQTLLRAQPGEARP